MFADFVYDKRRHIYVQKNPNLKEVVFDHSQFLNDKLLPNNVIQKAEIKEGVIAIGNRVFALCEHLREVKLPKSLETIEECAFYQAGLETISINKGLKRIGPDAFSCSGLKNVFFDPDSTASIGHHAFSYCYDLKEIIFGNYNLILPSYVCVLCKSLENVHLPENCNAIMDGAFQGCTNLKEIKFNEELMNIGENAFSLTDIEVIKLPKKLEKIHQNAFKQCPLKTIYMSQYTYFKNPEFVSQWNSIIKIYDKTLEELIEEGKSIFEINQILKETENIEMKL